MVSPPPARQRDRAAPRPVLRLFVEAPLAARARIALSPDQGHYVATVMRRRAGDALLLFNGRDGEWRARIESAARGRAVAALVETRTRPQDAPPDLWLLFAPVKRAPVDHIARLVTELGVAALRPVVTRRTVARLNLARLRANAIEAAEQCGRLQVPDCAAPEPLERLLAAWPAERRLLFCDETGGGAPVAEALAGPRSGRGGEPWAIAIGPEGGFAPEEAAMLRALPQSLAVSLGPRILRAETAAAAALALWQALRGDWT